MARMIQLLQACANGLHYGFITNVVFITTEVTLSAAFSSILNFMKRRVGSDQISQVIFFPDPLTVKRQGVLYCSGLCGQSKVRYTGEEISALDKLIGFLTAARSTIDVCVFTISCSELAEALLRKHNEGVRVRIITDSEQIELHCSQVDRFRREGIQIRNDRTSFLMHHKFVVIDSKLLMSGSFNWTRQALVGNKENVIITNDHGLVTSFRREFQKLWDEYDMEPRTKAVQTGGLDLRPILGQVHYFV